MWIRNWFVYTLNVWSSHFDIRVIERTNYCLGRLIHFQWRQQYKNVCPILKTDQLYKERIYSPLGAVFFFFNSRPLFREGLVRRKQTGRHESHHLSEIWCEIYQVYSVVLNIHAKWSEGNYNLRRPIWVFALRFQSPVSQSHLKGNCKVGDKCIWDARSWQTVHAANYIKVWTQNKKLIKVQTISKLLLWAPPFWNFRRLYDVMLNRHMTLIQRRLYGDATSWRCIDVEPTLHKRQYNVASTSMQRHDVASTLSRHCINNICLLE